MSASDPSTGKYAIQTLSKIGAELYLNEDFADFHFIFKSKSKLGGGQRERIPVHKMIIGTASDVFRAMFNGSWKEKTEAEINDASADAFKEFLQFFYLSEAELTIENVAEVMNLGKEYFVTECFNICGEFLKGNLDDDNVCEAFELAVHLEHAELEKKCEEYIETHTKAVLATENFVRFDQKTVKRILQMDSVVCSEAEVFEALLKWMKAKCEPDELTTEIVHDKFSDLWHEIRFGWMTMVEFLSLNPSYAALFTFDEYREIVQMIGLEQFEPKIFKKNRRNNIGSIQWDENAVICCNRYTSASVEPYHIKNVETTTFTVNKLVSLGSFTCLSYEFDSNGHHFPNRPDKVQSEITVNEIPNSPNSNRRYILYNGQMDFKKGKMERILLPKPILIQPGFVYEIVMKQSLSGKWCTLEQLKREVSIEPDIIVQFRNDPIIENSARGLIWKLEFNRIQKKSQ